MSTVSAMRDCAAADDHMETLLSVIVVNWNTKDLLEECLASVQTHLCDVPHEIIVVDNGSSDGSPDFVATEFPGVRLVRNAENLGFGRANNQGMEIARGGYLLLLNSDARLRDASIASLVEVLRQDARIGVIGPRLEGVDRALQPSAFRSGSIPLLLLEELGLYKLMPRRAVARVFLGGYWDHAEERAVDLVVGACMLVRADVFRATKGFDPAIFLYGEEEEWCARIRAAGWKIVYSPKATVIHLGHQTAHRFFGEAARVERCLDSADRLLAKRHGRAAASLIPAIRSAGALLKLLKVRLAASRGSARPTDEAVGLQARIVLRRYVGLALRPHPAGGPISSSPAAASQRDLLSRFGRNSFAVLASQVFNTLFASIFAVVFIRHFGREEYGVFTTVFTYLSFFAIFQSLGVDTVVLREAARDKRALDYLGAVAGMRLGLSLCSMLASWCLLPLIHPTARVASLVVLASLSAPLSFYSLYLVPYMTDLKMAYPNLAFGIWSALYTGARLAMIAADLPLEAFVVFSLMSDVVTFCVARKLGGRSGVRFSISFDKALAGRLLSDSWPIALGTVFVQLLLRIDQIMLYRMRGPVEVGLYAVPVRIVEFANIIPTVFVASAFPLLARLAGSPDSDRLGSATRMSFRLMAWVSLPVGTYLFAFPETCLRLLFGGEFAEASGTMLVLAYSPTFAFLNAILFNRLLAAGKQRASARLAAGAAGLNFCLNVPLISAYAGVGAAVATLIAYASVPCLAAWLKETREVGLAALQSLLRPSFSALAALAIVECFSLDAFRGALTLGVVYVTGLVVTGEVGVVEARILSRAFGWQARGSAPA